MSLEQKLSILSVAAVSKTSDAAKVHDYMNKNGFTHKTNETNTVNKRYVKRGFYDGDHPNGHRTQVKTENHVFVKDDTDKTHHKALHKHLVGLGYKHSQSKLKRNNEPHIINHYIKGKTYIRTEHKNNQLHVWHNHRSTKADKSYVDPGQVI